MLSVFIVLILGPCRSLSIVQSVSNCFRDYALRMRNAADRRNFGKRRLSRRYAESVRLVCGPGMGLNPRLGLGFDVTDLLPFYRCSSMLAKADQTARSFLFKSTSDARVDIVKRMTEMSPAESKSLVETLGFSTASATSVDGWEHINTTESVGEPDGQNWIQETLLHVAVRVGCLELVAHFISKGTSFLP